ncbi:hypothetical protein [Sediminimonas qiaohouensis]|uniref:hypothetical protein n=1 Tax=Sediminimonas qiaohouensis TaxID=552061 RepID=UPI0012EDEF2D|nr:hypothetical protein [Sediminimonas qiaohouensis]
MNITIPGFHSINPTAVQDRLHHHLSKEGDSLDALFRQVRGIQDVGEYRMLNDLTSKRLSRDDARKLMARVRACTDELLGALGTPAKYIDHAYDAPELDAALRWHAARLTDLERDLKRAFG